MSSIFWIKCYCFWRKTAVLFVFCWCSTSSFIIKTGKDQSEILIHKNIKTLGFLYWSCSLNYLLTPKTAFHAILTVVLKGNPLNVLHILLGNISNKRLLLKICLTTIFFGNLRLQFILFYDQRAKVVCTLFFFLIECI